MVVLLDELGPAFELLGLADDEVALRLCLLILAVLRLDVIRAGLLSVVVVERVASLSFQLVDGFKLFLVDHTVKVVMLLSPRIVRVLLLRVEVGHY